MGINDLKEKRGRIWEEMRSLNDAVDAAGRDFTADEQAKWDRAEKDLEIVDDEIRSHEEAARKREERAARIASFEKEMKETRAAVKPEPKVEARTADLNEEYRKAFSTYLTSGIRGMSANELNVVDEFRALQSDSDTAGGFLVTPEQFVNKLIAKKKDMVMARRFATVYTVPNAASLGAPALDNDPADPTWTAEIATGTEDSTMDFDKRTLTPHPLAKRIKISKKLLRQAGNTEGIVRDRMAYKFAVTEENAFLNGNGSNQPLGIFTASAMGINTGRDVSTGNTTTAIKADNLIECLYTLKAQYRTTARWIFHRDAIKAIRKLKDGNGDYLWKMGIASGAPNTILDLPYDESEYAPNTFTTGLYVGALCNWEYYWIADALNMQMQVLTELYAETNQNGYIARAETDGMPVLEEGFVRVTLA